MKANKGIFIISVLNGLTNIGFDNPFSKIGDHSRYLADSMIRSLESQHLQRLIINSSIVKGTFM